MSHQNLVQIYDAGLHEDTYFYAMELADSGTLKELLGEPLPWRDVVECGLQLAQALATLHENGLVHRDLKPANIYLSSSGHAKIGDFGLVRDLQADRLTLDGTTVGTVLYMAPEQITGEDEISGSADLYALGCVLFEMLTGQPVFGGQLRTQVLENHLTTPPPDPSDLIPNCPEGLSRLVQQLLQKTPQDRPRDAHIVAHALQQILLGEAVDITRSAPYPPSRDPQESPRSPEAASSSPAEAAAAESPNLTARLRQSQPSSGTSPSWLKIATVFAGIFLLIALAMFFGGS